MDPNQARHFLGPYLGPNCLQWLSAAYTSSNLQPSTDTFCCLSVPFANSLFLNHDQKMKQVILPIISKMY